jgi:hypothetical protein
MATPYTNIFERFSMKLKDCELDKLYSADVDDYNSYLTGFLLNAIPKFTECRTDLSDRDDVALQFNNTLTELEEEILANMIVLEWTGKELRAAQDLRRTLGDADFKLYSGANNVKEKRNLNNDTKEEIDKLINKYGWDFVDVETDFG